MKIRNRAGLTVEFLENGAVSCIHTDDIMISLRRATDYSGAYAGVWLRKLGKVIEHRPLSGPGSESRFMADSGRFFASGSWDGIEYTVSLTLSQVSHSWEWRIDLHNSSSGELFMDLVCLQDAGLKTVSEGLVNEYYISQYTERRILDDPKSGKVVFCRQNMKESGGYPWLMMASLGRAASACTDGMQFYGKSYRATGIPEGLLAESLGGEYAGESSLVALAEEPFFLPPGETRTVRFAVTFLNNHSPATSLADLDRLEGLAREFSHAGTHTGGDKNDRAVIESLHSPDNLSGLEGLRLGELNLFSVPFMLQAEDLTEKEIELHFPGPKRYTEYSEGRLLSFFYGENRHVMLKGKELLSDRPHGHIMHTRSHLEPDEAIMSTTAFAFGVFNSHITQGNTNFNTLLSVCNSQFNINPASGQRIFIVSDEKYLLLGVPSAFEMGLNYCRWLYRYGPNLYQVCTWTSGKVPQVNTDFRVLEGEPVALAVTHDFDEQNGWIITPGKKEGEYLALPSVGSLMSQRFPDARFKIVVQGSGNSFLAVGGGIDVPDHELTGSPLFALETDPLSEFCISFTGCVPADFTPVFFDDAGREFASDSIDGLERWKELSSGLSIEGGDEDINAISEILPWFGMNAITHFVTPYGLEQFSGAAWGTRDVSQGPVELLLATGKYRETRKVLETIFSNQEPDGGWPQWWMFDSYSDIRAGSAHGDVIFWCLIALSRYIIVTGDIAFLDAKLPYHQKVKTSQVPINSLREHVDRLVKKITDSFIRGKSLVRYGGGDWNDSLQPVSRDLADRLVSSWTVEMNYQAFRLYEEVCSTTGDTARAELMKRHCDMIRADFNNCLVKDDVVAGYGLSEDDGTITLLLHPTDRMTGISYSILPMERGIVSGIFTPGQAEHHLHLTGKHLLGPDGARLMDRPLKYSGGIQRLFQRAESSTFFGREIGLMYVHEHIRYAESLARTGRAEEFLKALRQAIPVAYGNIVPNADIRQANCYYSSSDAIFENRYKADEMYHSLLQGEITLRGGWRVYSSGPGIFISLIMTHLLGLRKEWDKIIIDPVMPRSLDGLTASLDFIGRPVRFIYHVQDGNYGPHKIMINGSEVELTREVNSYRKGGIILDEEFFKALTQEIMNIIDVYI